MRLFFFLALATLLVASLAPISSLALELNLNYPEFGNVTLDCDPLPPGKVCGQNPNALIAWIYYFIVGISGLAAFTMLVWGGVQWLTSGAIPSQAGEARDKIKNAILGLLLVLASFLIIQIINPELTILQLPGFNKAVGTVPTLPLPPVGGGTITITVNDLPSLTIPFPATSVNLKWSTTMSSPTCTATTDPDPFNGTIAGEWNYPSGSAPTSGTDSINLSSASDGTRVDFTLSCTDVSGTIIAGAAVLISSGGGGPPPVITQFEVTDHNNPVTWLPGGPAGSAPTYTCCGSSPDITDFPTSQDVRFRWNSTDATSCDGENSLAGHVGGAISNPGKGPIPILTFGPNTFTLKCIGGALPDARREIIINKTQ